MGRRQPPGLVVAVSETGNASSSITRVCVCMPIVSEGEVETEDRMEGTALSISSNKSERVLLQNAPGDGVPERRGKGGLWGAHNNNV